MDLRGFPCLFWLLLCCVGVSVSPFDHELQGLYMAAKLCISELDVVLCTLCNLDVCVDG